MILLENYQEFAKELVGSFKGTNMCRGCGAQLGLKIGLQTLGNIILINSEGCIAKMAKYPNTVFTVPYLNPGVDAAAAASGVWNSIKNDEKNRSLILVYAGEQATSMSLSSLLIAAENNDNIIYVCYNNRLPAVKNNQVERSHANMLISKASYIATASVAYPDDFVKKLKKAASMQGFKYIEIQTPCPDKWKFDPSNMIEVARMAVETGAWPVYEIENRKLTLTKIPLRLEPIERYLDINDIKYQKDELPKIQEFITKSWKAINEGKFV